jgi:protein TonB
MSPRPPFPPQPSKPNKHRLFIGILLAVVLLGGVVSFMMGGGKSTKPAAKKNDIVTITLPPPPPPPPPPPKVEPLKTEPPPDEKKEEIVEQEPDPVEPPPEAADPEPPAEVLGTNIQGNGPGMAGLGTSGNGGGNRNTLGGGGSKQARIEWYAKKILVTTIKQALERNPSTRQIVMDDGIRLWVDKDGRVTRIKPLGNISNLAAIEQVLIGLQTAQAPPTGMPPYIDFKIKARKPGI